VNIVYFGCDISLKVFQKLMALGHRILALYTYHNPYDLVHEENITAAARDAGIQVHYGAMAFETAEALFSSGACDAFVSAEYNRMIPIPRAGSFKGVNIHHSLLPEGKGFFTVETRRFLRIPYGGVTFHKLTNAFDEGDILLQEKFPLTDTDDVLRIYQKCEAASERMCQRVFADAGAFEAHWRNAKAQQGAATVWYPTKEERAIHPSMTLEQARHLFLCYDRFVFVRAEGGLRRVMSVHEGDPLRPLGRALGTETFDYTPYLLKDGVLWLAMEA